MRSRVLIIGHTGFLGSVLLDQLKSKFEVVTLNRSEFDLAKNELIEKIDLTKYDCSYVIICAAITDIEVCFKNQEQSHQVNVTGTKKLLHKIKQTKAVPIFFSSDYVFSYRECPLQETDEKIPVTIYGKQKLDVEEFIKTEFKEYLIFRTSKLMSKTSHAKNILLPILSHLKDSKPIKLFEDQWLNPVFVEDIAL